MVFSLDISLQLTSIAAPEVSPGLTGGADMGPVTI
jgi:hypothetical protein